MVSRAVGVRGRSMELNGCFRSLCGNGSCGTLCIGQHGEQTNGCKLEKRKEAGTSGTPGNVAEGARLAASHLREATPATGLESARLQAKHEHTSPRLSRTQALPAGV